MITLQSVENALKDVYLGVISYQLDCCADVVLSKIIQTTSDVFGNEIRKLIMLNPNENLLFKDSLETYSCNICISDKEFRNSMSSAGVMVNLINDRVEHMMNNMQTKLKNDFYLKLQFLLDNGNEELYGIKRKDAKEVNATIKTLPKFDVNDIQEIIDENNPFVDVMICSPKIKRNFVEYLTKTHQQRVVENINGFKNLAFNENIIINSANIPDNEIYLIDTNDFECHQLCSWKWLSNEDNKILRMKNDKPEYEATLIKYMNYICKNPSGQIKIILER